MSNINVFTNYYSEKKDRRRLELEECVSNNVLNPHINYIPIVSQTRMKFNDFFNIINDYTSDDDVNIICNLDIYFDNNITIAQRIKPGEFWCLARWDYKRNKKILHCNRPDSQDTWVFRGKMTKINADFEMGKRGCDNRLAFLAKEAGLNVTNPSKSVKTIHIHNSNIRNYNKRNKADLVRGPYHTITPTALPQV